MKQQQQKENNIQATSSAKADNYVPEPIPTSSANISGTNTNVTSSVKDETHSKNPVPVTNLQPAGSSSTMNQSGAYSSMSGSNKNEQKNICTVSICVQASVHEITSHLFSRLNPLNKYHPTFKIKSMLAATQSFLLLHYNQLCLKRLCSNIFFRNLK